MTKTVALSIVDLAGRLQLPEREVRQLLATSEDDGVVERVGEDGLWRLSAEGEARYGPALRGLVDADRFDGLKKRWPGRGQRELRL